VTVVRGLPGYGKTTQVATWMAGQSPVEVTSMWVTARPAGDGLEGSDGIDGFERSLSRALRDAGVVPDPGPDHPGPDHPGPDHPGPGGFAELGAALLIEPAGIRFVLVVDDFQHVVDEHPLAELVDLVARYRHFHLIVCCRGRHPIESVAEGVVEVNVIGPEELLLGVDEIVELARVAGSEIDRAGAERLRDAVGGWISAIHLAGTADGVGPRPSSVEEYLQTRVLADIGDGRILGHLMCLSLASQVSWRLFRDLWGGSDSSRLLDALELTGLVERVIRSDEVLFTIPAPIRGVLREQFISRDPDGARAFHRRLAAWYADHDDEAHVALAFHHATAGGDWDLADRLWSKCMGTMIRKHPLLMSETLNGLTSAELAPRPSMQVFRDILRTVAADIDADSCRTSLRSLADACERLVWKHWDTMSLSELLFVGSGLLIQLRLRGRFQDSASFGDRVHARAIALGKTEWAVAGRWSWFHLQRGITYSLLRDDASAVRSYRRAWELGMGSGADFVQSQAAANLALTFSVGGDTDQARHWLANHWKFDSRSWSGDHAIGAGGHLAAGLLALDRLDFAGVRSELDHLGDRSVSLELWPFVAYLLAQQALYSGGVLESLVRLDRVQAAHDHYLVDKGAAAALLTRARADLLIACGRGERAQRLIDVHGADMPLNRVPAARLRMLGGRLPAGPPVDPLTWDPATSSRDRLEMLLIGAVHALRGADVRNAQRLVNQALEHYGDTGVLRPFAAVPGAELAQLLDLADGSLEPADAATLLDVASVYPDTLVFIELSRHEQSVLEALAGTSSRQDIADSLFVSVNTVKTQLKSIYQKFGSSNRGEALTVARQHELLPSNGRDSR
jgi:LuxR family maltose regulon positive regulatory protein